MHAADPKVTAADVDGIVGVTFPELKKAVEVVARLMGVEMKEITPGEAPPAPLANQTSPGEPAASPTSTGSTSMAA